MTRLVSSSEARSSLWKKRWTRWRTRTSNWFCVRLGSADSAWTLSERTGCLEGAKRPRRLDILDRHGAYEVACDGLSIFLLDELREDAFKVGELQRSPEFGGRRVGEDSAFGDDNDSVADEFDNLQDMRDIENGFPLAASCCRRSLKSRAETTSRPERGSSKISKRGSCKREAAMRTRCFIPLES